MSTDFHLFIATTSQSVAYSVSLFKCIANERLIIIRPGASVADPIIVIDTNLPDVNICTSPPPEMIQDQEFLHGGIGPLFLGHIDLCSPPQSP